MSAVPLPNLGTGAGAGKKAVHVKWAGKTIALGTFPSAEADEKCARAKALTRAWRSTMRPKPSRDWVMLELERLGVRVVSGRLGRKAGEDDEPSEKKSSSSARDHSSAPHGANNWSSGAELDSIIQQRRSSSLGLSMMSDKDIGRRGSLGSLGPILGLDSGDPAMPPHRPLVGGGSAAAYEAARADHYAQKREEQRRNSGLGMSLGSGGMNMGLSVNPNQHYEMLKLHHMNLLNEIQETTLMMNLYQQQQLQQQQQQLQQAQDRVLHDSGSRRASLNLTGSSDSASKPKATPPPAPKSTPAKKPVNKKKEIQDELAKGQKEQEELELKLKKLRDDIAAREKEAAELEKKAAKRPADKADGDSKKKAKTDDKDE